MVNGNLEVRGLKFSYKMRSDGLESLPVLNDITFDVNSGEFLAIVGPSGCGKTTLLALIAGLLERSGGDIFLDGIPVDGPGSERVLLTQEQDLFPWKSVLDNVAFGLKVKGASRKQQTRIALKYLEAVNLSGFADYFPHQLSGGMRQRAALARALAVEPLVILMDEPLGSLDSLSRQELQDELSSLLGSVGTTTLLITHDVEEAVYLADRVLVLSDAPARIKEVIAVGISKPRRPEARLEPDFLAIKQNIGRILADNQSISVKQPY